MTLNDIIVSALAQLDRGHDSQTVDTWRDKLTRYANEAALDIAMMLKPWRVDRVALVNGCFDITALPQTCLKVISVGSGATIYPYTAGKSSTEILVIGASGEVDVKYRYMPKDMRNPTDVPEVPAYCHGLIVTYVVARERSSQDPSMQRGANIYFELYNAGKRELRTNLGAGAGGAYQIKNRW